ncbi:hypothetical protein QE152_g32271 [Popillia japonica]|uniref:Reverse transcriptase domain-containing protein n=1 Tax=Popillia japonica TaxID=7064 RepID=A0AAW1J097_POPJA
MRAIVNLDNKLSDPFKPRKGVCQGYILLPTLFDNKLSDPFKPRKGVCQGYILLPTLFDAYSEYIMKRALEGDEGGIAVSSHDTTLIFAMFSIFLYGSESWTIKSADRRRIKNKSFHPE